MTPATTHILIVDDDPSHIALIRRALLDAGNSFSVAAAENLSTFREKIAHQRPDMVLLDLNLPDGSTLAFLEQIASTNTCPILIMTSSGSEALAAEALKAGAIDYRVKTPLAIIALRASEQRFRTLLQDVRSVAVQGYRADGTVHYWKRAAEELYGYSAAEALGRNLCDLIIPEHLTNEMLINIAAMNQNRTPAPSQEYRLKRKDGAEVIVFTSHAVLVQPGQAPEFYCIDIDITERKKNEAQLNKLSQVVEQSPTMVVIVDLSGTIDYVNLFFTEVTGHSAEEIIDTNFIDLQLNGMTEQR